VLLYVEGILRWFGYVNMKMIMLILPVVFLVDRTRKMSHKYDGVLGYGHFWSVAQVCTGLEQNAEGKSSGQLTQVYLENCH